MPMPSATMSALDKGQPEIPMVSALKLTPTAKPSGMLWSGITPIMSKVRFLESEWGNFLSIMRLPRVISSPPQMKPSMGNSHALCQSSLASVVAGIINDQTAAAVINPALMLSIISSGRLLMDLKQKTTAEPNAVKRYVNSEAINNSMKGGSAHASMYLSMQEFRFMFLVKYGIKKRR